MKIEELRSKVEKYRARLKEKAGTMCMFTEDGPIGLSVIDELIEALESQQRRIDALERKIGAASL
jgi:hypothetical protein